MCPHTTIYVSPYHLCVLILLGGGVAGGQGVSRSGKGSAGEVAADAGDTGGEKEKTEEKEKKQGETGSSRWCTGAFSLEAGQECEVVVVASFGLGGVTPRSLCLSATFPSPGTGNVLEVKV